MNEFSWLPLIFILLIGLAVLVYAILDGYDLGVGILLPINEYNPHHQNQMIASIGPFWDANETWLVLAVGLILIAFPAAHSIILRELYLAATLMIIALILRGVSFDFRAKAVTRHRKLWNACFKFGSLFTALAQGYMLGRYVMAFEQTVAAHLFAIASAFGVAAAYTFIGGAWLVMKSEGDLQQRAISWTRKSAWLTAVGLILISTVNPIIDSQVFARWLNFPQALFLFPIPLVLLVLFLMNDRYLGSAPHRGDVGCWIPFSCASVIFLLSFLGLAYSYYPFVIPGQLTIWEAASAPEALRFILVGAIIVVPCILVYTAFSYRVFWGKTRELRYH